MRIHCIRLLNNIDFVCKKDVNVDDETLMQLTNSTPHDYNVSGSSPLGILFNNFKPNSMEKLRVSRIKMWRPGSPCTKKFLVTNTEFTEQLICTASREYQHLKIKQLQLLNLPRAKQNPGFKIFRNKKEKV